MTIKACWYKAGGNNFGDVICPILLHALTGQEIEFSRDEGTLVSIGSVAFHIDIQAPDGRAAALHK
jgi:hypothetical protein